MKALGGLGLALGRTADIGGGTHEAIMGAGKRCEKSRKVLLRHARADATPVFPDRRIRIST
jgi:hypothetical protein